LALFKLTIDNNILQCCRPESRRCVVLTAHNFRLRPSAKRRG
jgi:hypothetical protein